MTHIPSNNGSNMEQVPYSVPPQPITGTTTQRPPSAQSAHSSHSSSSSSKHVKCIGRYVLTGETLGKGNFARVEAAVHTLTRAKVAIKIIETEKIKEEYVKKNLLREAQLMRRLRHPNIIRLYETMKTNTLYCLVTEVAEGGELLSFVRNDFKERRLPEATTRPFIRQLTSALYYLHSSGVVHRDLKMENILLDKKKRHVKIVDFGLSNSQKPGTLLQTHCGSPEYAAPELFIPGRQYGPEVDVWSLGVNMYAMLVGKLPFRSPRQGSKKRQKLLEQISGGITEYHEKEMAHLSTGAQDLIGHLLQPDSSRRILLDEVMHHPWVTKDGTQPLKPYENCPPDPITQSSVMDLMQKVLGEPLSQIRETVRRDRCDWLAAIYNLLMDQPEGRTVLQRMLTDDPADQITSAADEYHSTAEHLSLSQSLSQNQVNSQEYSDHNNDMAGILTKPTFVNKYGGKHDTHNKTQRSLLNPMLTSNGGDLYTEHGGDYPNHLNKVDNKKHHHHVFSEDGHHGGYKSYTMHPSSASKAHYRSHRYSTDVSPKHSTMYDNTRKSRPSHHDDQHYHTSFGLTTPTPHTVREPRPHSRMSAPDPIPMPFQKSLYYKQPTSNHHYNPQNQPLTTHDSPVILSPSDTPSPTNHVHIDHFQQQQQQQEDSSSVGYHSNKRRPGSKNTMKKSLSGSIDTQLDAAIHGSVPWKGKVQVAPLRRQSMDSTPPIGWTSQTQFSANQKVGKTPADIQSLMPQEATAHRLMDTIMRSSNSTEIKPELFASTRNTSGGSHHGEGGGGGSRDRMTPQFDRLPNDYTDNLPNNKRSYRSSSARQHHTSHHNNAIVGHHPMELTSSVKHFGELEPIGPLNGLKLPLTLQTSRDGELPHIGESIPPPPMNKDSPNWKRKSFSGIIGKAFNKKSTSGNKIEQTNLVENLVD